MIESTTCGALQTSEKYSRPRSHLEPIDQIVESRRREVRWNTSRENLPRKEYSQSDDGRIYQEQNVGNRTTQNPGGLNLTTHLMFWWGVFQVLGDTSTRRISSHRSDPLDKTRTYT